jgi:hypothetical protein
MDPDLAPVVPLSATCTEGCSRPTSLRLCVRDALSAKAASSILAGLKPKEFLEKNDTSAAAQYLQSGHPPSTVSLN